MALYDIYTAKVFFHDDETKFEYKPVVQVKTDATKPNSFVVLTHEGPRKGWHGEIEVKNFKECGLHQKSTIRLTQRIDEPTKKKYIGTLTPDLAAKVTYELHIKHRIQKHKTEEFDDEFSIQSILNEVIHD